MSGMPHEEAKAYLDSYLARKSDQGMAVLIDGHWGAGKTWFVTTFFEERRKRLSRVRGADQAPDYLYASFFGAPDEAAIADQFLSQLYPALNTKLGKVLGTAAFRLGSALFASTSQIDSPVESSDLEALREWAAHPRERIVVFDDLERAGMEVERALALINGYVERDGIRVIVVANESSILSGNYRVWKEKVIGKTLSICADSEKVIKSITDELPSGAVKRYLLGHGVKVAAVARASTYPNYRSVKNLIADVDRLVVGLDERVANYPQVVESLILFSVGIGAEFRAGKLDALEILEKAGLYYQMAKSVNEERNKEVQAIYAKYANLGCAECIVPPNFLTSLWKTGEIQFSAINDSILTNPRVVGEEASPPWRRLWAMWDLGRSSYERAKNEALVSLSRGAVTIEGELLHIIGVALQVEHYGAKFFENEHSLDWLRSYLERAEVRGKLEGTSILGRHGSHTSYMGLGYTGNDLPSFAEAQKLITAALWRADEDRKIRDLAEYVRRLRNGDYEPISLSGQWSDDIPYGPWLHLLDAEVFVSILVQDGRVVRDLSRRMAARYESDSFGDLRKEWDWLLQVRSLCAPILTTIAEPHRTISRHRLLGTQASIRGAIGQARARMKMHSSTK